MMKKAIAILGFVVFFVVAGVTTMLLQELRRVASDDPLVWEDTVNEMVAETQASNPPGDAVLFVGSSSIRFWDTLKEDMAPLEVIQHGFGGAKIHDVVYFSEELITQWNPSKVVIFAGSNDINASDNPQSVPAHIGEQLETLLDTIFDARADTHVFYIEITATKYSWEKWSSVQEANQIAEEVLDQYPNARIIKTNDLFLNEAGKPNGDYFMFDGLHLNAAGYALWTRRIKPYLLSE